MIYKKAVINLNHLSSNSFTTVNAPFPSGGLLFKAVMKVGDGGLKQCVNKVEYVRDVGVGKLMLLIPCLIFRAISQFPYS